MLLSPSSDHQRADTEWTDSLEAQNVCRRVRGIFALSTDSSIFRAVRKSIRSLGADCGDDILVLDAVHRLTSADEAG